MTLNNFYKYGALAAFLIVFLLGGSKHGYFQAAVVGLIILLAGFLLLAFLEEFLGE